MPSEEPAATHPMIATYRLQLRNGIDFATAKSFLPYLADLGVSHLYLSPIFTATEGSTHGYDVANPQEIDPVLGGEAGFRDLSEAAQARGLGVVLDLVPNHTALSLDNPWIRDAMRHGPDSAYAEYFAIDWSQKLILPFLPEPLDDMLAAGKLRLTEDHGGAVEWEGGWLPLAPGTATLGDVASVLTHQHWQLRDWTRERGALSHRRFFNVTGLIGMRVEDPAVFDAMTELPARLVREGLAHGLRIDHIDGLADPVTYLERLRRTVGDAVPIWVEKILTGDEAMPAEWQTDGTTGYEAGRQICRVLTAPDGFERLDTLWRDRTGGCDDYETLCREARAQVIPEDLAAELHQLIDLAQAALAVDLLDPPDAETLRDAMLALLIHFPRYRTYITAPPASPEDRAVIERTVAGAAETLPQREALDLLAGLLLGGTDKASRKFRIRFQQVTGAVVAKSQEDTAFFRHTRYLAANEVGAEPDMPVLDAEGLNDWFASAQGQRSGGLTLTSSHDTKRGEDTRMRVAAISHRPETFAALFDAAMQAAAPAAPGFVWYATQSLSGIWDDPAPGPELSERLTEHLRKALREGGEITRWSFPDIEAEETALDAARRICAAWEAQPPAELARLIATGKRLSLLQLALKMMLPGMPDIYQRGERALYELTDPDNRRPFALPETLTPFERSKSEATRQLLSLRRAAAEVFRSGAAEASERNGVFTLTRRSDGREITLRFCRDLTDLRDGVLFEISDSSAADASGTLRFPPPG